MSKPKLLNAAVRVQKALDDADWDDDGEHETRTLVVRKNDIEALMKFVIKSTRKRRVRRSPAGNSLTTDEARDRGWLP